MKQSVTFGGVICSQLLDYIFGVILTTLVTSFLAEPLEATTRQELLSLLFRLNEAPSQKMTTSPRAKARTHRIMTVTTNVLQ